VPVMAGPPPEEGSRLHAGRLVALGDEVSVVL